ncbi:hypothetical protein EUX98_g4757 [Antrodiella citrinella]|uniref:Uncharacterized protein n=1 Tax=Antrodiella citrinella TaxID=2447956 RepID=A0A4S4MTD1_9APHY|nr:hypothetical protein EUX98_g4757 [Antrodiella citrinella]
MEIFRKLREEFGGPGSLTRTASSPLLPASSDAATPSSSQISSNNIGEKNTSKDVDAMDVDQDTVATGPNSRIATGHPITTNARPAPRPLTRRKSEPGDTVNGLATRMASMDIRKVKPLPSRAANPSTPKKKKSMPNMGLPAPPNAPKKMRTPSPNVASVKASSKDKDVLPNLQRKSILKRKADDHEGPSSAMIKKARIVDEPAIVIGTPRRGSGTQRGGPGGRGVSRNPFASPSRQAVARRRRSMGDQGMPVNGINSDDLPMISE